jgi:Putative adhesin
MRAMERPSRTGLISLLIAVEVVIAGLALYTLRGGFASAGGFHEVDYSAPAIAPIGAGLAPIVTVDDIDSHVIVTPSNDGLVHVTDRTQVHGFIFGSGHAQALQVSRTLDGVRIYRPEGHFTLGDTTNRVELSVPPMTQLHISRSGGDDVSGLQNGADVVSQDGHISLDDMKGDIKAHSDDGRITLSNVSANQIDASTNDGRIYASQIEMTGASPRAMLHSDSGSMRISGTFPSGNYAFTTSDGRIELGLLGGSDASVDASTGDGHIVVDGRDQAGPIRVGGGSAAMRVRTEDGSVHITTNGAL